MNYINNSSIELKKIFNSQDVARNSLKVQRLKPVLLNVDKLCHIIESLKISADF